MKNIVVNRKIFNDLNFQHLYPIGDDEHLDSLLNRYAVVKEPEEDGEIRVVSFAAVSFNDQVLTVSKPGGVTVKFQDQRLFVNKEPELVLGFGRVVCVSQEKKAQSLKVHILDALYEELDAYLPGAAYIKSIEGLITSRERLYDRHSLGCLFNIQLEEPLADRTVGEKFLSMNRVGEIDPSRLRGWSEVIYQFFLAKEGVPCCR
jgi:hypothetical protein